MCLSGLCFPRHVSIWQGEASIQLITQCTKAWWVLPLLPSLNTALTEAQDIHLHLTPLKRHLEDIERVEFSEVKPFLAPLLHMVCLIWVTSKHYNVPVRIVVLLQEICNLLIQQVGGRDAYICQRKFFNESLLWPPFPYPSLAKRFLT